MDSKSKYYGQFGLPNEFMSRPPVEFFYKLYIPVKKWWSRKIMDRDDKSVSSRSFNFKCPRANVFFYNFTQGKNAGKLNSKN